MDRTDPDPKHWLQVTLTLVGFSWIVTAFSKSLIKA